MSEIKQMLAKAERVEVAAVLFREDFYALAMNPVLDPAIADLEVCWQVVPQRDWTISADDEDNMTAHSPTPYEPPSGWRWVATIALLLITDPKSGNGMYLGRSIWFAMSKVHLTPHVEAFLDFLRDEMGRPSNLGIHHPTQRRPRNHQVEIQAHSVDPHTPAADPASQRVFLVAIYARAIRFACNQNEALFFGFFL